MAVKEDLRVQRTKKALAEAYMSLLNERPFDEITINDLCDKAGVRRATFYKHYNDKYDFLASHTRSLRDAYDREEWPTYTPKQVKEYIINYAKKAIEYINENETAVNNLLRSSAFASALSIIVAQNYNDTLERLRDGVAGGLVLPCSVEVTSSMLAGGVFTTIFKWLSTGKKVSPEELANDVGNFVASIFQD